MDRDLLVIVSGVAFVYIGIFVLTALAALAGAL